MTRRLDVGHCPPGKRGQVVGPGLKPAVGRLRGDSQTDPRAVGQSDDPHLSNEVSPTQARAPTALELRWQPDRADPPALIRFDIPHQLDHLVAVLDARQRRREPSLAGQGPLRLPERGEPWPDSLGLHERVSVAPGTENGLHLGGRGVGFAQLGPQLLGGRIVGRRDGKSHQALDPSIWLAMGLGYGGHGQWHLDR